MLMLSLVMEEREALWGAQRVYTEIVAPWTFCWTTSVSKTSLRIWNASHGGRARRF